MQCQIWGRDLRARFTGGMLMRAVQTGKCPICGQQALSAGALPFCSDKCRQLDLHRWLSGQYRVQTQETPDLADTEGRVDED